MEATATLLDLIALMNRYSANASHRACLSPAVSDESADGTFPAHLVSTYFTVSKSLFVRV